MKIIAVLLIIISVLKLIIPIAGNPSDSVVNYMDGIYDKEQLLSIIYAILSIDGLLGLFCGLFILFAL